MTGFDTYALIKAIANPTRVEMIEKMGRRRTSSVMLSRQMTESLPAIAYHMKALERAGVVQKTGTRPRRGATETFYKTKPIAIQLAAIFRDFEQQFKDKIKKAA